MVRHLFHSDLKYSSLFKEGRRGVMWGSKLLEKQRGEVGRQNEGGPFGFTNPNIRHTLSPFGFLAYHNSGQPRTQGLSSFRHFSRSRGGMKRDPGKQVGFSRLCQFKEQFLSVQLTCYFSYRSVSLPAINIQSSVGIEF